MCGVHISPDRNLPGRFRTAACTARQVVELTADSGAAAAPPAGAVGAAGDPTGVPALVACRVKLIWEADAGAAAEVLLISLRSPVQHV